MRKLCAGDEGEGGLSVAKVPFSFVARPVFLFYILYQISKEKCIRTIHR